MKFIKDAIILFFVGFILLLSIRGDKADINVEEVNAENYINKGAIELSPERGRYSLTYSIIEKQSLQLSPGLARFSTPDVAYYKNNYVSLFAPGLSFLIIPGYYLGKILFTAQLGAYATIAIFALLNFLLVKKISEYLGISFSASLIGAGVFLFATPSYAYAVSLYQHHISTFLILVSLYLLFKYDNFFIHLIVWFFIGFSFVVDYPNILLMLPVIYFAFTKTIDIVKSKSSLNIDIKIWKLLSVFIVIIPFVLFILYNKMAFGEYLKLSGSLPSVDYVNDQGQPVSLGQIDGKLVNNFEHIEKLKTQSTSMFFNTRNLINGLYTHTISLDRGMFVYAPVLFFSFLGIVALGKKTRILPVLIALILINITVYSLWGDPWGGWAFGSRYLVPSFAIMGILIAAAVDKFSRSIFFVILFILSLYYSVSINTLGALTTNLIPPEIQVLELEKVTGKEQKYNYLRNREFLNTYGLKSYLYQTWGHSYFVSEEYYVLIVSLITMILGIPTFRYYLLKRKVKF